MSRLERLRQLRAAAMLNAESLPDDQAVKVPTMYEAWAPDTAYQVGNRRSYGDYLYKCVQAHTSQTGWEPPNVPALWAAVNKGNAGTIDDPIPAARGMEYEKGKYYLDPEDGQTYLCNRGEAGGTVILQYLPHELVGHYFEVA